jgi:hypothetical protein
VAVATSILESFPGIDVAFGIVPSKVPRYKFSSIGYYL